MNSDARPLSLAMLTLMVRPNISFLFSAVMALCAAVRSTNRMNATPLLSLVSLSFTMVTLHVMSGDNHVIQHKNHHLLCHLSILVENLAK